MAVFCDQDLGARSKERVEALPLVADDRRAASGGFEQPHARRIPGGNHVGAREVEGETLTVVESAVAGGRQVLDALHVAWPNDVLRILRAGDDEPTRRQIHRRLHQQALESGLPVHAVSAEIAEVPLRLARLGIIRGRIHRAVERTRGGRAPLLLQLPKDRAARERQIHLITRNQRGRDVTGIAVAQLRQRHRRIDVVERRHARGVRDHPLSHHDAVRHVGTHDDCVGRAHLVEETGKLVQARIQAETRARQFVQIAIFRIPRHVAFDEVHVVAAPHEFTHQPAIGRRVAVAPRGREGETEDHNFHQTRASIGWDFQASRPSSNSSS